MIKYIFDKVQITVVQKKLPYVALVFDIPMFGTRNELLFYMDHTNKTNHIITILKNLFGEVI